MLNHWIALLVVLERALALSSHSPIDLESYPAYSVNFNEHGAILNKTAQELLREPPETPPHSLPLQRHLLRTPSGQGFLCTVPSVTIASKQRARARAELDESTRHLQRQRGLERGLALLEPMRGGCIYLKQNWFTYSFCYGSEIRQFHAVQVAGQPTPKEDPNAEAYVLGISPEPSIHSSNPKYGSGSLQVAKNQALIPSRLGGGGGGEQGGGIGLDESGRYLVQVWEGGSTCDKTGLPRTVEVQFHCNTQTIDRIALIRETSICRYVLLIHTPRLCAEPLFLEGADKSSEPPSIIDCQPIVSKLPLSSSSSSSSERTISNQGGGGGSTDEIQGLAARGERIEQTRDGREVDSASTRNRDQEEEEEERGSEGPGSSLRPRLESSNDDDDNDDDSLLKLDEENDPDYLDATTLTLVYNAETGEIESVETSLDQDFGALLGGGGDKVGLERREGTGAVNEEVTSRIFDGRRGGGESEAKKGSGQAGVEGREETEAGEEEEGKKAISVDQLEDMVRLMADSLTSAMKGTGRQEARDDSTRRHREEEEDGVDTTDSSKPENERRPQIDVMTLLREVWGVDAMSKSDLAKVLEAKEKLRSERSTKKKGRGGGGSEAPKNAAFEQMRRGFGRRYDDDKEEEDGQRVRDEL